MNNERMKKIQIDIKDGRRPVQKLLDSLEYKLLDKNIEDN